MSTTVVTKVGTKNADQVVLLDAAGDQVTSFGGGTQYTEGDTDASITGTAALMEVGSNTLQPVQGTVADGLLVNLGSNNDVTVASLPLPALAATSTKQSDGSQKTQVVDGSGNVIAATSNALNVHIASGSSSGTQYTEGDTDASITGTALLWEDTGDTLRAVSAAKPLPVSFTGGGDASAANQTTIIGHVDGIETILGTIDTDTGGIATSTASIDTKTPALGQALAAASVPVVLTAAQLTTLTPVSTVTVTGVSTLAEQQTQTTALQLLDDTVATLGTTTYTEAATKGHTIGAVRRDADTTLVDTTNEIGPLQMDANGRLKVEAFSGEALPVTDNAGSLSVDWNGTQPVTGSGNATGALRVELANNGTGLLTANPGTAANWGIYVEDAGETAGGNLMMAGTVRRDTAATSAGTTGDNATLNTDSLGRLWVSGAAVDDAAETAGGILLMAGSVRRDTAASSAGTTGDNATINTDATGRLWTTGTVLEDVAHSAGESLVGSAARRIDTAATSAGSSGDWATIDASAEGALWTTLTPTTTSGCTIFKSIDLDESEEEVKATAGNVYGYYVFNAAASVAYLKFYNATAANVTVGTTTPVATFPVPAGAAANVSFAYPMGFSTAICAAVTTGLADNDTGAPAANAFIANIFYK